MCGVSVILGNQIFRLYGEIKKKKMEYPLNGVPISSACLHGNVFCNFCKYLVWLFPYVFIYLVRRSFISSASGQPNML